MDKKDQEIIRTFLWRFGRVFLATFIAQISIMQISWDNPKAIMTAVAAGVIAALAKIIRDGKDLPKLPL